MRVLVLTPYLYGTTAGPRSSFELWERVLRAAGIEFEYAPFEDEALHELIYQRGHALRKAGGMLAGCRRRAALARRVGDFDAVLINREAALIGPALLERWVARLGVPIVYLLDDPLYVPYRSPFNGWLSYLKFFGKVRSICRMSALVIANSPHHRAFASALNSNVWEIPSVVDGERYFPAPKAPRERVCVGWSGSPSTAANLSTIAGVLDDLRARSDVELRFIGAGDAAVPGSSVPWSAATEVEDLRRFDIGLVPLASNEWNKRKFILKLVQYMALGIPAIATPIGSNPFVIDHGRTGLLAAGRSQWLSALELLADDAQLRGSIGTAAAADAAGRYTLQAQAERIVGAFRSIDGRRRRRVLA